MTRPALASLVLHLTLATLLMLRIALPPAEPPPILAQVELVVQNTPNVGDNSPQGGHGTDQVPAAAPPAAAPSPAPALPAPPQPQAQLPLPTPPPRKAAPPSPAPVAEQAADPMPSIRLGDTGELGTGLVSGDNVIPAAPDSTVRNKPPAYPVEAARRGEEGDVILTIHVAPDGTPSAVDIAETSGSERLDRAARQAVLHWHFHPAQQGGLPIASTMPLRIRFVLNE
ncbi:MAG: energy transducer TonB [Acidisphaera sp.]|nr:energy transducer TonB [Acidisphaera sp.]